MNNEHKKLPTFGKRPLLPVGTGAPTGTRCLQLMIPDDDMAARQLLGTLRLLTFWQSFEREASHLGTGWAIAWRNALAASVGQEECMARTELRVDDICTLSWSYDDWVTFDSYDPSSCITALIDSVVPGMITQGILDAISDGTIEQPGGQPGPTNDPAPGSCETFHVRLDGSNRWLCPFPVSENYSVEVTNYSGGWTDGAFLWYCPDGKSYILRTCGNNNPYQPTDPLQAGNHMQIIGGYDETSPVWFDAIADVFVIPAGVSEKSLWLQANDGNLTDNQGEITFDVTVCSAGWVQTWDFELTNGGFTLITPGHGTYVFGEGWKDVKTGGGAYIEVISPTFDSSTIIRYIQVWELASGSDYNNSGSGVWAEYNGGPSAFISCCPHPKELINTQDTGIIEQSGVTSVSARAQINEPNGAFVMTLKSVTLWGLGVNPFI